MLRTAAMPRLSAFSRLQLSLLLRIAPAPPDILTGAAYKNKSKLRVLLGDTTIDKLKRADAVLDFGCGYGGQAVELAQFGCKRVIGLDIQMERLQAARAAAAEAGVAERCEFVTKIDTPVQAIVSLDAFEHFEDPAAILGMMASLLEPGGRVYACFGPTWYHPLGGHMFSIFPWAHLVFGESALCAWRELTHSHPDGATQFREIAGGLNQMTIGRFERIVAQSPLQLERLECVPIRPLRRLHYGFTREWTTAVVRCDLLKLA